MNDTVAIAPHVAEALSRGGPVVALETAVLTHGLAKPRNLETFRAMEQAVTVQGAVPAAVAVIGGRLRVGLSQSEWEGLGLSGRARKTGLADLPALAASKADAGTTVAATLWAARAARIRVFATGGIGGVHRGAENTFDVSGDLGALSRFGGCVVCSGAKAILDLPKTLELLESLGVCIVGFGTNRFPAFVCPDSGLELAHRVETPAQAAEVIRARDGLGLPGAVIVANPPPADKAVPRDRLKRDLEEALAEAERRKVTGAAVTPFLLERLAEATGGMSLETNRALLVDNAELAAKVALELAV